MAMFRMGQCSVLLLLLLVCPSLRGIHLTNQTRTPKSLLAPGNLAFIPKVQVDIQLLGIEPHGNSTGAGLSRETVPGQTGSRLTHTASLRTDGVNLSPRHRYKRQTPVDGGISSGSRPPVHYIHRTGGTSHVHSGHSHHPKYQTTHVDYPGEHLNNSTVAIIHRVPGGHHEHGHGHEHGHNQGHGHGHIHGHGHQHGTHVDMPGLDGNNSSRPLLHRGGDRPHDHTHVDRGFHVDLPGVDGNYLSYPIIHRHGNATTHSVSAHGASHAHTGQMRTDMSSGHGHGQVPSPSSRESLATMHLSDIPPYQTDSGVLPQYPDTGVHIPTIDTRQSVATAPTLMEDGVPVPSGFLVPPTFPAGDFMTPAAGGMLSGGPPFGPAGGHIAPHFVPHPPFGPLAHLPPLLRRRIRRLRRFRRRMRRRLRRLRFMRELGLLEPHPPIVGPVHPPPLPLVPPMAPII